MNILITGGAGFIGSQLGLHLIRNGQKVILLDNLKYGHIDNLIFNNNLISEFICKDIRDGELFDIFKHKNIDLIVHLAGISSLPECQCNPCEAYSVNVAGTANILELARKLNVKRVLFASTSAVYENAIADKFQETEHVMPDLVYASTKRDAENLCISSAKNYNQDIIICRFFNVFGPHQDVKRKSPPFTSYLARELVLDRAPTVFNNTDFKRDYIYVTDLIDLVSKMMFVSEEFKGDIFNVGVGTGYSAKDIYSEFLKTSNKNILAVFKDPMQYWDTYPNLFSGNYTLNRERIIKEVHKNSVADMTKTKSRFSWEPRVSFQSGVGKVYSYTRKLFEKGKL